MLVDKGETGYVAEATDVTAVPFIVQQTDDEWRVYALEAPPEHARRWSKGMAREIRGPIEAVAGSSPVAHFAIRTWRWLSWSGIGTTRSEGPRSGRLGPT
jgi:hypothetical protein